MRLVEASERLGVPVLVGHHRRHNPVIQAAKKLIAEGALGRLVMVSVCCALMKPERYFQIPWHRERGVGGPFLINLIHEVDLLRHLCGEVDSVSAMKSNAVRGLDVEDTGGVLLRFDSGVIASIAISDSVAAPWSWDLTSGEVERFPTHEALSHYLCGTEGGLSLPALELWRHDGDISWTGKMARILCPHQSGDPYVAQLRHFGELIKGLATPLVSAREATRNLEIVMAMHEAATRGTRVKLS
ncbi:Gfo/Idh/MocA family protein [Marinobacterium aestuariivivens]|uniref:Gfo/Idh/MocA family protein n=1 Tax=Marinobacterium aestuariivivens TaxID=1698799 RepID=A0ABW2A7J6_9GAMM